MLGAGRARLSHAGRARGCRARVARAGIVRGVKGRRDEDPRTPDAAGLRRELLAWYRRARRDLPWRRTRDPYAIWISEAMLQQTRVETVLGYYARFLERFPDVAALAAADEAAVLAAWSGLGYYRRARALQAGARALIERHGGHFPRERAAALELPGVGPYTAGAVLSIAFDRPEALVDGNVARVLARLCALDGAPASRAFQERAWSLARALLPARGAGTWNQALMELGALVCTPRTPDCARCPWRARCAAHAQGRVGALPEAQARPASVAVELECALVLDGACVLLEQRPDGGRMAGLWQLPTRELGGRELLAPSGWPRRAGLALGSELASLPHTITRHRIRAVLRRARRRGRVLPASWRWCARDELASLALTGLTKKCLAAPAVRAALAESVSQRSAAELQPH